MPQGGLEVSCHLNFLASSKEICKTITLLPLALSNASGTATVATNIRLFTVSKPGPVSSSPVVGPLSIKHGPDESYCDLTMEPPPIKRCRTSNSVTADAVWLKLEKVTLSVSDKEALCNHLELNDRHINYCQGLLKKQFPLIGGFILTLLQNTTLKDKISCGIQIIHCQRRNHWIVAVRSESWHNPIRIYDSIFRTVDEETKRTVMNLFKKVGKFKFIPVDMQVQEGNVDCGLFTIAVATDLAYGNDPANVIFVQKKMRNHVLENLESGSLQPFPRLTKSTDN